VFRFFPHEFNLPENQNYIGPYRPADEYGYKYMTVGQRREFDLYYADMKTKEAAGGLFDFKTEFEDYCKSIVIFKSKLKLSY
jgi:hypothetical protein